MGNVCECGLASSQRTERKYEEAEAPYTSPVVQLAQDDLESNESDDDVVDELPKPSAKVQKKNRQSVSAEAYGEWNKKKDFVPPVHAKSPEEKKRIQEIVENSFLFSSLDVEELEVVLGAFAEVSVQQGETLIHQGADGDQLYLIESGEAEVYREVEQQQQQQEAAAAAAGGQPQRIKVNTMKAGDTVGELALMYNSPRAATVVAATDLKLWALDRATFTHIVRDAAAKKREAYEESLKEVSLLKDVDPYERSKMADALKCQNYEAGDTIISEGQEGDTFYLLLEGEAEAVKGGKVVMSYSRGSYFGELALLRNQPRAATVRAKTNCKTAYMDRRSFKRLLGPLEALLMRNMGHYRQVMEQLGMDSKYLDR